MIYVIPVAEFNAINNLFPNNHAFGYFNDKANQYEFNDNDITSYQLDNNFTYDTIFQNLYNQTLSQYLATKSRLFDSEPRIYNYVKDSINKHFHDINYKTELTQPLHPQYFYNSLGYLVEVKYYLTHQYIINEYNIPEDVFLDIILKVEIEYFSDGDNDYMNRRITTRTWYNNDGTENSDTKVTDKYYSSINFQKSAQKAREFLIHNLTSETAFLLFLSDSNITNIGDAEKEALPLLIDLSGSITTYIKTGYKNFTNSNDAPLIKEVLNDTTHTWLNTTVVGSDIDFRTYFTNKLKY